MSPGLLETLSNRAQDFDAVIFFTYLYTPTAWGVPLVAHKALVVPTAHDEPALMLRALDDVFHCPRALLCNTAEEVALIESRFPQAARRRVVGVGIEPRAGKPARFKKKFDLNGPYLLYLGRLEEGKGVLELTHRHQSLVRDFHDAPTLVFAGAGQANPRGHRVVCVGRLDERDKWDAISGAMAVVVPSRYESLSLVTLEAFAAGVPVLGNSACAVVSGHIERSGGGVAFDVDDDASFAQAVQVAGERRAALGNAGKAYAAQFRWERVVEAYLEEIELIRRGS